MSQVLLKKISLLRTYPEILIGINRGIEREALRIQMDGNLASTMHPRSLGSPLTHKWITTDFSESLLELITPISSNRNMLLSFLRDIHRYVVYKLGSERIWPFSMPCVINCEKSIKLAQYGSSNIGKIKTVYRSGLRYRYGSMMQIISGVHYNFSLPIIFWQVVNSNDKYKSQKDIISNGYLHLIRNYYRFGWIVPYLFGASPAIYSSPLYKKKYLKGFKQHNDMLYLPYATSLRLGNLGHKRIQNLQIIFNDYLGYVKSLKWAISTPSKKFTSIGLRDKFGNYLQLNNNILQIEDELYIPIRPRSASCERYLSSRESLSNGIEYVEVRSLDVNPFSPIGIDVSQLLFLDIFLIWCSLIDAPDISEQELININKNWKRIIFKGRKPDLTIKSYLSNSESTIIESGKEIFDGIFYIAQILDYFYDDSCYTQTCDSLFSYLKNPELTYSARILNIMKNYGIISAGLILTKKHYKELMEKPMEIVSMKQLAKQTELSILKQKEIENNDILCFDDFLRKFNTF